MRWTERQLAMLREMGVQLWPRRGAAHGGAVAQDAGAGHGPAALLGAAGPGPARASPAPLHGAVASAAPSRPAAPALDWRPAECLVVCDTAEATPGDDGAADRLLGRMLHAAQLSPDASGPAGRACRLALAADRSTDLDAVLAAVRPRAILALGRAAAQALLGNEEPLGRLRGRLHARAALPVVVSFAPAYLLRHPEEKAKAWTDLCLLAGALEPAGA